MPATDSGEDSLDTAASIFGSGSGGSDEGEKRRKRFSGDDAHSSVSKRPRATTGRGSLAAVGFMQEYDIEQMEERAERLSDMAAIRWRADRFEEEVAPELTMVARARDMNERLGRFREQEEYGEFD